VEPKTTDNNYVEPKTHDMWNVKQVIYGTENHDMWNGKQM